MRQVRQRLEETKRRTQEKAENHSKTERETLRGTREGAGPILGSNETNKEERESTTEEVETKRRCISASVSRHHKDHQRSMTRA